MLHLIGYLDILECVKAFLPGTNHKLKNIMHCVKPIKKYRLSKLLFKLGWIGNTMCFCSLDSYPIMAKKMSNP